MQKRQVPKPPRPSVAVDNPYGIRWLQKLALGPAWHHMQSKYEPHQGKAEVARRLARAP